METEQKAMAIKVLEDFEAIETIRPAWEQFQKGPGTDIAFFRTIVESRPEVIHPRVLVVESEGIPKTLLVGRVENTRQSLKIGYAVVLRQSALVYRIIDGGLMGDESHVNCSMLMDELLSSLKKGDIDIVAISNLRVDTTFYNLALSKPGVLSRDHFISTNPYWSMDIPVTQENFYMRFKAHRRHELRRLCRVLNKEYGQRLSIKKLEGLENVTKICNDLEEIAKKTYHRNLGVGFIYNEEFYKRFSLEAERGRLRAYILYIDDIPKSFWLGYLCNDTFYLAFTGYDPAYRKYELGTVLFIKMVEDLSKSGLASVDFGSGAAMYKEKFGTQMCYKATVCIFAPSFRGLVLNASQSAFIIFNNAAKKILLYSHLLHRVKTLWRKFLQRGSTKQTPG